MSLHILLLLSEVLFNFPKVDDFSRLFFALAEGPLDFLLELYKLFFMPLDGLRLHALCFFLVIDHFAVPIFVKVTNLFQVSHLHLAFFFLEASEEFLFPMSFELFLDFSEATLSGFGLHILACLFACLLMRVKNLSKW